MLARAEFDDRPWGIAGEMLPAPRHEPVPTVAQPFQPPPPDWEEEARLRRERGEVVEPQPSRPLGGAVSEMMAAAQERGELEEPRALGPPVLPLPPLRRPVLPEPNWREEERERARLEREAAGEPALAEEQPSGYPPPRRQSA
jgi:hypothetical protein